MRTGANPQGKGLVPVVDAWRGAQPSVVRSKSPDRILADYFTSLLVLSSEFQFRPSRGGSYYLYLVGGNWRLSLISPPEWGSRQPGPCLGRCQLNAEMTWSLDVTSDIEAQPGLVEALEKFHEGFMHLLDQPGRLEDSLPFYSAQLAYYPRLFAAGLSSSLAQSLQLSGLADKTGRQWRKQLSKNPVASRTLPAAMN